MLKMETKIVSIVVLGIISD